MDKDTQFKAVIETHRDRIYRIACCYVRDENDRQDICQEVAIRIWRSLSGFQGRSGLSTWVYRITVNTCLDHLRSTGRRNSLLERGFFADRAACAIGEPAGDAVQDDVRDLHECIRRLGPLERTLISLYLEDVGTDEMAEVLGISAGNVRTRLHRTKQSLKAIWEQRNHGL